MILNKISFSAMLAGSMICLSIGSPPQYPITMAILAAGFAVLTNTSKNS